MARKTNWENGGIKYFRKRLKIGIKSDGKPKYKTFLGKSEAEAIAKRDKYKKDIAAGLVVDDKPSMSIEYLNWLNTKIKISGVKLNTFDRYMTVYNIYVKDNPFSHKEVDKITTKDIQSYFISLNTPGDKLFNSKLTYSGFLFIKKQFKRFFTYCQDERMLIFNPVNSVIIPNQVKEQLHPSKTKTSTYTIEDRDKLLNYIKEKHFIYGCLFEMLFLLGCRSGELLGLKINEIDLDNNRLYIVTTQSAARVYNDQGQVIDHVLINESTKNSESIRTIYFNDEIAKIIKSLILEHKKRKLKNPEYENKENLLFTTVNGTAVRHTNFRRYWAQACEHLNIEYKPPHKSRHTFITMADDLGVPRKTIQKIVGHSIDSIITEKVYIHTEEEKLKNETLELLNKLSGT